MSDRRQIIEETYIKPIRSVIAVDDDFPTMDSILAGLPGELADQQVIKQFADERNIGRIKSIVRRCRNRKWIVDIHNGAIKEAGESIDTQHLHQTDLMILDYELSKSDPKHENSHKILKELSKNPHFNMVVIYSNELPSQIFRAVLPLVLRPVKALRGPKHTNVETLWKQSIDDDELSNLWPIGIDDEDCFIECRRKMSGSPEDFPYDELIGVGGIREENLVNIDRLIATAPEGELSRSDVVRWLLWRQQEKLLEAPQDGVDDEASNWKAPREEGLNWIRSGRLFITIVKKSDDDDIDLIQALTDALCDWNPSPGRIILSKARAELDENGGLAEDQTLSDRWTQAGWLYEVLSEKDAIKRQLKLTSMLSRQTELLHAKVSKPVLDHAEKILARDIEDNGNAASVIQNHLHIAITDGAGKNTDQGETVYLHYNTYECSREVFGSHLTTGHVLRLEKEYWLCVSPACDLVPGQHVKKESWPWTFGHHLMPVKLLKLHYEPVVATALKGAADAGYVFLNILGDRKCFAITPGASSKASPILEQMLVANQAKFSPDDPRLVVYRPTVDLGTETPETTSKEPQFAKFDDAVVIAQLRYEYALNVLQRVGSNLSRVGLDFVPFK